MDGSKLPEDSAGAYVNVYVPANAIVDSIERAEESLLADFYRPIETISAVQIDEERYDSEYQEEGDPEEENLRNLKSTGGIWYACFHLYPHEQTH